MTTDVVLPDLILEPVTVRNVDLVVSSTGLDPNRRYGWRVRRVSPPPGRKTDDRGEVHTVTLHGPGLFDCDCAGWQYRGRSEAKSCRHVDGVKKLLGLEVEE